MLGQALAQQIANEITDVIGHNVLITDESGIVMGSGDESRVGQFHEASVEVVRSRRTTAHSSEDVRDLVGTLPGVTIPLVIDDKVVGTIGLSGSPERGRAVRARRQTTDRDPHAGGGQDRDADDARTGDGRTATRDLRVAPLRGGEGAIAAPRTHASVTT